MAVKGPSTVLLVTPPYHCGMVESAGVWMPLGLAYLAGAVRRAGYDPEIYDAMSLFHDMAQIRRRLADRRPDVVAVTAYTATMPAALDVLRAAKEECPGVVTVIGGVHPTHMAAEVLADHAVDYVVRGEGELTLPELLDALGAGEKPARVAGISYRDAGVVVDTPDRPFVHDLDALPIAWDLIDWPTYYYRTKPGSRLAIASWARGCTEACSFCSQQKLWRRTWRPRGVEAVVAEARMLRERFGVDTLEVADEYPTRDGDRWERILDRLIEEDLGIELLVETRADDVVRDAELIGKYRDAGILHMYVGVESVRQERLDAMRKRLRVDGLTPRDRPPQRGRHHHRDLVPASAFQTTRRRPSRRRCGSRSSTPPTSLSSSRPRRGRMRTGTRTSPTGSRSPTTPSTTSSTPSFGRMR